MKHFLLLALAAFFSVTVSAQQILSVEKLETFSKQDVEDVASSVGVPAGIVEPETAVDYYKITYLTPYLHPDSLVQASGAIAVPVNPYCSYPLVGYGHGTQSKRSKAASYMDGGQWELGVLFASTGYVVALPDYLGLGDADPKVAIHPYTHAYSQSNTMINMLRATRTLADSIETSLNGQVFLFGYSQGGGTTVATVKEIEQNYPNEFDIVGSAPMSGAYDLINAQVDLIASENVYPTPGYLPYIVLAYQSIYGNLYNDVSEFLKSPYDSIIPDLFYEGNTGIGNINQQCPPVPKDIVVDSVVDAFLSDPNHPLRLNLLDNDLIEGWYPTSPMKLIYCQGDDQVTYLNSENAYNSWTTAGAPFLQKQDLGNYNHGDCALFAMLVATNYFDSIAVSCALSVEEEWSQSNYSVSPNPATDEFIVTALENAAFDNAEFILMDVSGKAVRRESGITGKEYRVWKEELSAGIYFFRVMEQGSVQITGKVVFQ